VRAVYEALLEEIRAGRACVLATVVRATGSTPRAPGAVMAIRADGGFVGTIGGGAFEAMVVEDARDLLASGKHAAETRRYTFTEKGEDALGMACGGTAEVFLKTEGPGERLVIFGAGHVGLALARLAATVGFRPEIVDDRADACAAARRLGVGAVTVCAADYEGGVPALDERCSVAVVTRCHRTDRLALRRVIREPVRYLGLIGSKRKKAILFESLRSEDGVAESDLARVKCPIGLPVGGDTPEEIAISIVAELLQERYKTAKVS